MQKTSKCMVCSESKGDKEGRNLIEVLCVVCLETAACWRDGNITFTLNYTLCNCVSCPPFIGSRRMGHFLFFFSLPVLEGSAFESKLYIAS